jgi:SAM-dependent methyltransferase
MDWRNLEREKVRCALCGADEPRLLSVCRGWPVVRCRRCGLVYLRERPSENALGELYGRDYYDAEDDVGYRGYMQTFHRYRDVFRRIFDRRHRDLRRHTSGNRLLEVGCAYGTLLAHLREKGWEVSGVEVSPLSSRRAREDLGLDVRTGKLEEAGYPDSRFDVVLLLDVLEHLHRPFQTLGEISRILAPGGTLVVQCPYELYHWEEVAEAVLRGKKTATIEPDSVPAHLYFFVPRTLDAFLRKGGFRIAARQSGNYGEIRRRVSPPEILRGSPAEVLFRLAYYRLGIQRLLYTVSRWLGQGSGLIRYATPRHP